MTEEELFPLPQFQVQKPSFFQGLGQAIFPDQPGVDEATSAAARQSALLQFGLGTLGAASQPGARFGSSVFSGLNQAAQTYQGAVQNAYTNSVKKSELELRQKTADREEKAQARLDKQAVREDRKAAKEVAQESATTATRLSAGIKNATDPVAYLGLVGNAPEVQAAFEEYGIDPTSLSTPEAIRAAGNMLGQAGAVGLPYEKPERSNLQLRAILGPDGKPILVPEEQAVNKTPYERRGTSVTLPDGTIISDGGPSVVGPAELSKPTINKLQETIVNSTNRLDRINQTLATYNPDFLRARGLAKATTTKLKDFVGIDSSPDDRKFLDDYSQFTSNAASDLSSYLKELSGAAVTPQEYERLAKSAPTGDEISPTDFEAKAKATIKQTTRAIMRANFALKQGIGAKSIDELSKVIPLGAVDKIYEERANEIWQELGGTPEAKAEAVKRANQEFGLAR